MFSMDLKPKIFSKIGFWRTLEILSQYHYPILMTHFYKILNGYSYYNAFFRAKKDLLSFNLIKIEKDKNDKKRISFTEKGREFYDALIYIKNRFLKEDT